MITASSKMRSLRVSNNEARIVRATLEAAHAAIVAKWLALDQGWRTSKDGTGNPRRILSPRRRIDLPGRAEGFKPHGSPERLRTLTGLCSHSLRSRLHQSPRKQLVRANRRPVFDGADHRRLIHTIGVCHGGEPLLAAHSIDHSLLPSIQNRVRKNGEVTEHP